MDFKGFMLSKKSERQKDTLYVLTYMQNLKKSNLQKLLRVYNRGFQGQRKMLNTGYKISGMRRIICVDPMYSMVSIINKLYNTVKGKRVDLRCYFLNNF